MKERPILFSAPMVRALLAGTKTQTRRAMKPQPVVPEGASIRLYDESATHMSRTRRWNVERPGAYDGAGVVGHIDAARRQLNFGTMPFCTGDRLWVREAWARTRVFGAEMVVYREGDNRTDYGGPWKPGIHMFRRDSRILLEITEVRVERLQSISVVDARAEGIVEQRGGGWGLAAGEHFHMFDPRISYWSLWEAIHGAGSVEANPWVWVVAFRRASP